MLNASATFDHVPSEALLQLPRFPLLAAVLYIQSVLLSDARIKPTLPANHPLAPESPLASPTHTSILDFALSKLPALTPLTKPLTKPLPARRNHTPSLSWAGFSPPTEIECDIEQSPEKRMESLLAVSNKMRDFAYEPMPNASEVPEAFDPVPCLIAAGWHVRNPY